MEAELHAGGKGGGGIASGVAEVRVHGAEPRRILVERCAIGQHTPLVAPVALSPLALALLLLLILIILLPIILLLSEVRIRDAVIHEDCHISLYVVTAYIDVLRHEQKPRMRMEYHQAVQKSCLKALAPCDGA